MKKYLLLIFIFISSVACSQTIYQNEKDLFLNSDESANAFRYNPAILGLGHKFNVNLNLYYDADAKGIREFDVQAALGHFGFAFDNYNYETSGIDGDYKYHDRKISIGLGYGSKKLTGGVSVDFMNTRTYSDSYFENRYSNINTNTRFSVASMYRPSQVISLSAVYRTYFRYKNKMNFDYSSILGGIGLRPFKDNRLELFADGWYDLSKKSQLGDLDYKFGANIKIIEGLKLNLYYGSYYNAYSAEVFPYKYFGAGFSVDLGNLGIRTNANYLKEKSTNFSKYNGNTVSLNYSLENRGNIIPERNHNLQINLSGTFQDYYTSPVLFGLLGGEKNPVHSLIKKLDDASANNSIKGMVIYIDPLSSGRTGINASLEELCSAIERFKKNNKKVVVYLSQGAGVEEYYIATYADKIVMPREASFSGGIEMDVVNYKGFLAKFGIDLEAFSAGKYKLTFQGMLDSSSSEGKVVINRVLDVVYEQYLDRIKKGRNIELTESLKDDISGILNPHQLLAYKMIDVIGWYNDAVSELYNLTGINNLGNSSREITWNDRWQVDSKIAVIGIYGGITTGESTAPFPIKLPIPIPFLNTGRTTGSQTILRQLESAFSNDNVKAVILRVNSGGGSALASAEIYDAIKRLKEKYKKPFIVTMGDVAGSGGYYVSANGDIIFASNTTMTGSIGVIGAYAKLDSLAKMLNIKVETFTRGKNSGITSQYSDLTSEQKDIIKKDIDYVYEEFLKCVIESRKISREKAEEVAQGRVWLGIDALDNKLIDKIGGFFDAFNYAKKVSGLENERHINLVFYPVAGSDKLQLDFEKNIFDSYFQNIFEFIGF